MMPFKRRRKKKLQVRLYSTSSNFWVRASLSSSDISGLNTAIVSYCLSPGGHCGSSFSSTAVKPGPAEVGSSSEPNPPSKNEPEKSRVWALVQNLEPVCFWWIGFGEKGVKLWEKVRIGNDEKGGLGKLGGSEEEIGVQVSEEEAIDWLLFASY